MAIPPPLPEPEQSGPVPPEVPANAAEPPVAEPPLAEAPLAEPPLAEPPAPTVAPGTGFARPEAVPAVPASATPAGGYPSPYAQPAPGAPASRWTQGPQAPGYYPQQTYYAPGWTAPPEAVAPRRSHTRLFLGLAIGLLVLLLIAGGIAWYLHWQRTRSLGEITTETGATAQQVAAGHCIAELPDDGSVSQVTLVPCDEPHEAQVVGTNALQQDTWPGQAAVDDEIAAWCEMDRAALELGFQAVVWTPTESSWSQGDHRGVCIAWHQDGAVTGSLEDGTVQVP